MTIASRRAISRAVRVGAFCTLAWLSSNSAASAQAFEMHRVSVSSDGTQPDKRCTWPIDISHDGRIVIFQSEATNLVPDDTDGVADVFLHDLYEGTTVCASVGADGHPAGGTTAVLSGDGRWVVFLSDQLHVHPTGWPTGHAQQVFIYDRETAKIRLVSASPLGEPADQTCYDPKVTADGRYVFFRTEAVNIVPKYAEDAWFVADLRTGTMSYTNYGCPYCGVNFYELEAISDDGSYLSQASWDAEGIGGAACYLTSFLSNPYSTLVPIPIEEGYCDLGEAPILLSFDGRFTVQALAFWFCAPPSSTQILLNAVDRATMAMDICNTQLDGKQDDDVYGYDISPDGRFVSFASAGGKFVPGDTNEARDIFLRDTLTHSTQRISLSASGDQADIDGSGSGASACAGNGTFVAFTHDATNLVPGDTDGVADVFVYDRDPWFDLGSSLAGSGGPPRLAGLGTLEPAAPCRMLVSHAVPSAAGLLFLSLQADGAPFKGGVLVAFPPVAALPLVTDANGRFELVFHAPPLLSAVPIWAQCGVQDSAARQGVALSNALKIVPP